jgi:hypothetical protein
MKLEITRGGVLGAIFAAVTDAGRARGPAAVPRPSFLHLALVGPAANGRCRSTCYSSAWFSWFAPYSGPLACACKAATAERRHRDGLHFRANGYPTPRI